MQKITPFLWFNDNAEEAVNLYVSLFRDSKILAIARYPEGSPGLAGSVMTVNFELQGQQFTALNGGTHFELTEAFSLVVNCNDQAEIDTYWEKLSEGGEKSRCGWLKDRFGLSWQIVPTILPELIAGKNPEKSKAVMDALMKMDKLDIETLKQAYAKKK